MSISRLHSLVYGRFRRLMLAMVCMVAALFAFVAVGPRLFAGAAHNWGYIALNRAALGPTYSLGRCAPASRYSQKAGDAFTFAREIANDDTRAESGLAIIRLCSGDLASATQLLQDAHRSVPGDPVIGARLGNARLLAGDASGAVAEWNDAGAASAELLFLYQRRIASEEWMAGSLLGAFSQTAVGTPPMAFYWLATWLEDQHNYGQAAVTFGRALADPAFDNAEDRPAAARGAARDWAKTDDWQTARTVLEATLIQYPDFPDLWVDLGDIYRDDLHDDTQATQAYERAMAIPGAGPAPYVHLGDIYLRRGQVQVAMCYFQVGLQVEPTNPFTHVEAGRAYLALADFSAAAAEFELALAEKPDLSQARVLLGDVKKLAQSGVASRPSQSTILGSTRSCPGSTQTAAPPGAGGG